jgi:hypothetical protein
VEQSGTYFNFTTVSPYYTANPNHALEQTKEGHASEMQQLDFPSMRITSIFQPSNRAVNCLSWHEQDKNQDSKL